MIPFPFVVADKEFYAPLETARDRGEVYRPGHVPDGWSETGSGVWTMWHRGRQLRGVEDGWKVHVSARPGRLPHVLDTVAAVCFEQDVAFKHLSCHLFYWWTHHKQAARAQNGKFIAAYPTSVTAARDLMERLREALADEDGPYILTDRRYRDSRTVHYRYGAFAPRERVNADGTHTLLVRGAGGALEEDRRGVSFHLPAGVSDPFAERRPAAEEAPPGTAAQSAPISFHGFEFEEALQFTNGGGAYVGRETSTGRRVFIKEARAYAGVSEGVACAPDTLRTEHATLVALHEAAPGLGPEPLAYFREWEHDFLVTEFIEGSTLSRWMVAHQTMLGTGREPHEFREYHARCEKVLGRIEAALERLHTAGYAFVDVSPGNVLVSEDDGVRLIDFEGAQLIGTKEFRTIGTPGYMPPPELAGDDPLVHDAYGFAGLALLLVGPFHQVAQRNPDTLAHLHGELVERAPLPDSLWRTATRFHQPRPAPEGSHRSRPRRRSPPTRCATSPSCATGPPTPSSPWPTRTTPTGCSPPSPRATTPTPCAWRTARRGSCTLWAARAARCRRECWSGCAATRCAPWTNCRRVSTRARRASPKCSPDAACWRRRATCSRPPTGIPSSRRARP